VVPSQARVFTIGGNEPLASRKATEFSYTFFIGMAPYGQLDANDASEIIMLTKSQIASSVMAVVRE
jgi:hypothetical protein